MVTVYSINKVQTENFSIFLKIGLCHCATWMTFANFLLIPQITDISVALYKMEQNFKTNEKK